MLGCLKGASKSVQALRYSTDFDNSEIASPAGGCPTSGSLLVVLIAGPKDQPQDPSKSGSGMPL